MAKGKDERHNPNRKVSKKGMTTFDMGGGATVQRILSPEIAGAITGAMDKMMRAKSPEDQAIYDDDPSAYLVGEIGKNLEAGGAKRIK